MKVAIVGGGHISRIHAPAIRATGLAELVAVCDVDERRAKASATELGAKAYFTDIDTLCGEVKPDVVHILTPPATHCALSIAAINHGCNVLVEKPMALNLVEADEMLTAARQRGVLICVGHNMVFDTLTRRVRQLVDEGVVGDVVSVETSFRYDPNRNQALTAEGAQYGNWIYSLNGGPLEDLMPHPASLIFEFMDGIDEIQTASQDGTMLPPGWPGEVRVLVKSGQVLGYISISLHEKPDSTTLSVFGNKGSIYADYFGGIIRVNRESVMPRAAKRAMLGYRQAAQSFKGATGNLFGAISGRFDKSGGVQPLVSSFYEAVRNKREPPIPVSSMRNTVKLTEAVWPVPSPGLIAARDVIKTSRETKQVRVKPTALVTGASGFIGTHIVNKLIKENIPVRAVVRPNSLNSGRLVGAPVEVFQGDISDKEAMLRACEGIETIYHAGASTENSWDSQRMATLEGTRNIIEAAQQSGVKRMVHLSTLSVYELLDKARNELVSERSSYQSRPEAMGAYAHFKIEAEKLVHAANENGGLAIAIVRPGMVIGEGGHPFFPHLGFNLGAKVFILIGKGDVPLPFTYVGNVVDGIYLAATRETAARGIYNLVDDANVTAARYVAKFIEVTGIEGRVLRVPYAVPYTAFGMYELVSGLGLLKKGITSRAQLRWKQARVLYDTSRAKKELGWIPTVSIEEAMERTFKAYAEKYHLERRPGG